MCLSVCVCVSCICTYVSCLHSPDSLCFQDNLIIDQPRQRRQTRRFGNDSALVEEVEEEEAVDLVPARGKKGWTKLELQKVERYLLIYGWNQWKKVLHSGFKGKKIRLNERDVENMSRTIVSASFATLLTTCKLLQNVYLCEIGC